MWLDPGYGEKEKGFAMLIDVGTMALIHSDRKGYSSRGGEEEKERAEKKKMR